MKRGRQRSSQYRVPKLSCYCLPKNMSGFTLLSDDTGFWSPYLHFCLGRQVVASQYLGQDLMSVHNTLQSTSSQLQMYTQRQTRSFFYYSKYSMSGNHTGLISPFTELATGNLKVRKLGRLRILPLKPWKLTEEAQFPLSGQRAPLSLNSLSA